jgi:enediyne biosynthesis protein E4
MGDGTFVEAATPYGLDSLRDGRGLAVSDFDGDGGLDFIINNYNGPAQYFVNRVPNRGHWLRIRLRGHESNREGIGAIIRARTGDHRQMRVITAGDGYASQYSRVAHFGLGDATVIDELEVTWPNHKTKQTFHSVPVDRLIEIDERQDEPILIRAGTKIRTTGPEPTSDKSSKPLPKPGRSP